MENWKDHKRRLFDPLNLDWAQGYWGTRLTPGGPPYFAIAASDRVKVGDPEAAMPSWERYLYDFAKNKEGWGLDWKLLELIPAAGRHNAVVVVRSREKDAVGLNHVLGFDAPSGKLLWRCVGTGVPVGVLSADTPEGLPGIVFQLRKPYVAVCRQAVRVTADGRCVEAMNLSEERPVVPLPWVAPAQQRLTAALWPAAVALALLGYCICTRRWIWELGMLQVLLAVVSLIRHFELQKDSAFALDGESYDSAGWYFLWPFAFTKPVSGFVNPLTWMLLWLAACQAIVHRRRLFLLAKAVVDKHRRGLSGTGGAGPPRD